MLNNNKWTPVLHNKTGNKYYVVSKVINCTNAANDCIMILYINTEGMLFCREEDEFWEKFTAIE